MTISDGLLDRESRGPSGPGAIVVDLDLERIDGEPRNCPGIGSAHRLDPRVASVMSDPRLQRITYCLTHEQVIRQVIRIEGPSPPGSARRTSTLRPGRDQVITRSVV